MTPAERCANSTRVRSVTGLPETGSTGRAVTSAGAGAWVAAGAAEVADALETAAAAETEALWATGAKPAGLAGAAKKASSSARSAGNDRNTEVRCAVVVMAVKVIARLGRPRDAARRAPGFTRRWRPTGAVRDSAGDFRPARNRC
ncbi:hypothetical protein Acy02nite_23320 [Actinoplanes cyaneus]|uniref:Uncharacterized protein n=1 Tax=Actinoplanes cyaneus TaxID=52696 RepID=A0A919IHE7_9ACTN|nr:hypothetical protein Acy02nite_23320 [Actinoplanes cyaneus]